MGAPPSPRKFVSPRVVLGNKVDLAPESAGDRSPGGQPDTAARALFVDDAPDGWLAMLEATLAYGVSRQTLMQRVKRGELQAVHVRTGRRKGLRIPPPTPQNSLF